MNLLEDLLNRHERDPRSHGQRQRDRALSREESAALASASSAQRKVAFDRWVRSQIAKKLAAALPEAPAQRARLVGQIAEMVETMLVHLYQRRWLLDGKRLAAHVTAALDEIATAHAAGRVRSLYPFAQVVICRYVGTHAEEIQQEARRQEGFATALIQAGALFREPSLVELAALRRDENIKAELAAARKAARRASAEKQQGNLL